MRKLLILSVCSLLFSSFSFGQNPQKHDYHSPIGIPQVLSSNFGELRPNHFHMGLDFKTNGKIGYKLYAVEKGFVSRIKVSPYGYGKVVYIDHPHGITSVYAHCSEFKGQIDSIVRVTQQKEQNFAVEIFPKKDEIKVSRGQVIAISGNTGGSTAPHLHFELRDTKTEHALNPLVYGFELADSKKPEIRGMKVYSLTKDGYRYPNKSVKRTVSANGSRFVISESKITIPANYLTASGGLGFAFDVIDRLDGAGNQCGLYGSILLVNGDTLYGQQSDRIPFESTRYVNCHKDYEEYAGNRRKYHKCFRTTENDLPIYINETLGILKAQPGSTYDINYIAFDANGNRSELHFDLVISSGEMAKDERFADDLSYLHPSQPLRVESNNTTVEFGTATTYEPLKIEQAKIGWSVGKRDIPVHKAYEIRIHAPGHKKDDKDYIQIITAKGKSRALNVTYDGDDIVCQSKYFGNYTLKRDTIKPTIAPVNFSKSTTVYSRKKMQWRISDRGTGLADYDLFIDGQWKLLEYEYKNGMVTYTREPGLQGEKEVLIRVVDDCGNKREWITQLTFK